jgi:hypothetical protein
LNNVHKRMLFYRPLARNHYHKEVRVLDIRRVSKWPNAWAVQCDYPGYKTEIIVFRGGEEMEKYRLEANQGPKDLRAIAPHLFKKGKP